METAIKKHHSGPKKGEILGHQREWEAESAIGLPSDPGNEIQSEALKDFRRAQDSSPGWISQVVPAKEDSSRLTLPPARDVRFPLDPALRYALEEKIEHLFDREGLRPPLNQLIQHYAKKGLEAEITEHDNQGRLQLQSEWEELARERLSLVRQQTVLATEAKKSQKLKKRLKKAKQKCLELKEELEGLKAEQERGIFVSYTWLFAGLAGAGLVGYGLGKPSPDKDIGKILETFSKEADKERLSKAYEAIDKGLSQPELWRFVEAQFSNMPAPLREAFDNWIKSKSQGFHENGNSSGHNVNNEVL